MTFGPAFSPESVGSLGLFFGLSIDSSIWIIRCPTSSTADQLLHRLYEHQRTKGCCVRPCAGLTQGNVTQTRTGFLQCFKRCVLWNSNVMNADCAIGCPSSLELHLRCGIARLDSQAIRDVHERVIA